MIIDTPRENRITQLRALWREAFGDTDEFLDVFWQRAFAPERCRTAEVDGRAVGALYWFDCSYLGARVAYLYAVATAKAYRGQGICTALMNNTHKHLRTLGYEGAILVPGGKELFDFYSRLGYTVSSSIGELDCKAGKEFAELRQITPDEYARRRREYLPIGGVIQENENMSFLTSQANLYAGNGFILAARRERDTLYGIELLGNAEDTPAIVRSLGCAEGRFRMPGNDKPFAMYLSLGDKKLPPPSYFGLAFD